jgi:hypothetical protein
MHAAITGVVYVSKVFALLQKGYKLITARIFSTYSGNLARDAISTGRPSTMGYRRWQPVQSMPDSASCSDEWHTGQTSMFRCFSSIETVDESAMLPV